MRNAPVYRPLVDLATLEERHIIQTYRLNRQTIMDLVTQLELELLPAIRHPSAIPPTVQVLSVLHFLVSGSFQMTVSLAAGMSQPMFSNSLKDVLCALLQHMASYIRFPHHADLPTVKAAFYNLALVTHMIGAIYGIHIVLVPPRTSEQVYSNRKNFYSTNVQVVCQADQYITQVTVRLPGSVHDSYFLQNSTIPHIMAPLRRYRVCLISMYPYICVPFCSQHTSQLTLHPPGPDMAHTSVHTGDSGYPDLPWLLTPVRHPTTVAENRYNEAHGSTRRVTELTIGLLKARFKCLHIFGGALLYTPQKVCQIIVAC
ncbi:putative nuclease HARBI1 [Pleurodeles waltl]|uniref:putative nuclease HARBI1 n=1 Tax=Pleurodeles waltl TaxID=8319 RepID=UPI003709A699